MNKKKIALSGLLFAGMLLPAISAFADEPIVTSAPTQTAVSASVNPPAVPSATIPTNPGQIMRDAEKQISNLRTQMNEGIKDLMSQYKTKIDAVKSATDATRQAMALRAERDAKIKDLRTNLNTQIDQIKKNAKTQADNAIQANKKMKDALKTKVKADNAKAKSDKKASIDEKKAEIKDIKSTARKAIDNKREEIRDIRGNKTRPVPPVTPTTNRVLVPRMSPTVSQ